MSKGGRGLYLEAWKFSVYISLPIIASVYYTDPERQKKMADYWKFISYPENPNTNVRQKIQELAKEKDEQREHRLAYQRQLQELQRSSDRAQNLGSVGSTTSDGAGADREGLANMSRKGSVSWLGRWFSGLGITRQDS